MLSSWAAGRSVRPPPGSWRSPADGSLLLEAGGEMGQAWSAAAGMLAPQIEAEPEDPLLELGLAGRELYSTLAAALRETTGIDIGLWREGIARVAANEAEAADLRARCAWQRQHGHLGDWLDADEVRARWPWLGPTAGALWAPHEGALEPERLVEALLADAERLGATLVAGHGDRPRSARRPGHRRDRPAGPLLAPRTC